MLLFFFKCKILCFFVLEKGVLVIFLGCFSFRQWD